MALGVPIGAVGAWRAGIPLEALRLEPPQIGGGLLMEGSACWPRVTSIRPSGSAARLPAAFSVRVIARGGERCGGST